MIEYCTHGTAQCGCGGLVKSVRDAQAEAVSRSYSIGPLCSISNGTTLEDAKERTFDMSDDFKNLCELMATEISSVVETKKHVEPALKAEPAGETRIVDPSTGGAKGKKLASFSSIPPDVLWELAEHYGKGNLKYPDPTPGVQNWMRSYDWKLSIDALERHLSRWKQGQEFDIHNASCDANCTEHTNSPHLVAVAWHCFALRYWTLHAAGQDTRYFKGDKPNVVEEAFRKGS